MISIEQGSDEWLALRKNKITSTDAATIMGVNPWCTPFKLWQQKLGLAEPQKENEAMRLGKEMEEEARQCFIEETGIHVKPAVMINKCRDWQMTSLDGITDDLSCAVEIKCSQKYLDRSKKGELDDYCMAQCQHHICTTGATIMIFYAYWDGESCLIEVLRDDDYIENLIEKEKEFYRCIEELDPPPLTKRDVVERDDFQWLQTALLWRQTDAQIKELEKQCVELRKRLIGLSVDSATIGGGVKLLRTISKGRVDYSAIPMIKDIDLEEYRRPPVESWRLQSIETVDIV